MPDPGHFNLHPPQIRTNYPLQESVLSCTLPGEGLSTHPDQLLPRDSLAKPPDQHSYDPETPQPRASR
ncbi:MAG: hypothetical protein ACI8X5_000449 [Planctomycetota bacterium]|jgi:hypothetical protein